MNTWILIIILSNPNGTYIDKVPVEVEGHDACLKVMRALPALSVDTAKIRVNSVCVPKDQWTGRKPPAKGVSLD
jgi:hypothetical protein